MNNNQHNEESEQADLNQLIHDARGPLNRISMQAEMIKLVLENDMPVDKALEAAAKIIASCQECSQTLEQLSKAAKR
ncbi:histidine kinase [Thalassotalea piscium]|uniref:Signal transduction histidine kinase n=1 Tax=Thalassotalea piscium TaxID=1230533 RepID=A0A7X0NJ65_9GAMM|nr:histidine kinase [Thalassotalea piscium]MBB6544376.1 signal transduction histidine kinase [Thalassotalea piscium]